MCNEPFTLIHKKFLNEGVFPTDWVESNIIPIHKKQKHPSRGVLKKRCPENMQQIYRRAPMSIFNKIALQYGSSVNWLHFFIASLLKNTSKGLLLKKKEKQWTFKELPHQISHLSLSWITKKLLIIIHMMIQIDPAQNTGSYGAILNLSHYFI